MDALHLHKDLSNKTKWNAVKLIGLSGTFELIQHSADRIIAASPDKVVYHRHYDSMQQIFEDVAHTDVDAAPRLYIFHGGLDMIQEKDLLKLDKLSTKNYFSTTLVFTGSFQHDMSKKVFTRTTQRFYDLDFSKTDAGRARASEWIKSVTGCDKKAAETILDETEFDLATIVYIVKKISVFETFTTQDVKMLATEFVPERFVKSLVSLDYVQAMNMAKQVPPYLVPRVLLSISSYVKTIAQVHPVTRVTKTPTRMQAIDYKVPINVLHRWWNVAGRYSPEHQIRRLVILAEASHRYYTVSKVGVLENLVLAW